MLLRGNGSGTVGPPGVVGVLPIRHGREPVPPDDLVRDAGEKLVLAMEAAVGPIAPVLRPVALARLHLDDPDPDPFRHLVCGAALVRSEARRDTEDRDRVVRAE